MASVGVRFADDTNPPSEVDDEPQSGFRTTDGGRVTSSLSHLAEQYEPHSGFRTTDGGRVTSSLSHLAEQRDRDLDAVAARRAAALQAANDRRTEEFHAEQARQNATQLAVLSGYEKRMKNFDADQGRFHEDVRAMNEKLVQASDRQQTQLALLKEQANQQTKALVHNAKGKAMPSAFRLLSNQSRNLVVELAVAAHEAYPEDKGEVTKILKGIKRTIA